MKKVVLLICVLISIYSCNTKNKETDLEKLNLKGDVISVITEGGFGSPILEFDNNGNLLRTIEYHSNDDEGIFSLTETSIIRDSTNKIIVEKIQEVSNHNLFESEDFVITKKYNYLNDKLATINYETKYGDNVSEKYKYENDNLVEIKEEFYSGTQDVRSHIMTTNYFYNKKNHIDSTRRIRVYEDGVIDMKLTEVYKYNDNNDLVEEKVTDLKKNEVTQSINYNYIYDNKNNWIEKKTFNKNGKLLTITKREIVYY